jgi:hypothetical protein
VLIYVYIQGIFRLCIRVLDHLTNIVPIAPCIQNALTAWTPCSSPALRTKSEQSGRGKHCSSKARTILLVFCPYKDQRADLSSLVHHPQLQYFPNPPQPITDKMCFGGKNNKEEQVVIRKYERPRSRSRTRYSREYVSRPEVATYRRETVTRRSRSGHRPSYDRYDDTLSRRSGSRSRIVREENRRERYY